MVGKIQGTNTFVNDKKIAKKKILKKDVSVTNVHRVCMKGISFGEKATSKFGCVSPLVKPKEFKLKTLKKVVDHIPFPMSGPTSVVIDPQGNLKATRNLK